ncbi:BQ2448_5266 [Microbotryum intermedium]|uniref:BQ2448_5266 protein n=1 Tax=Microbotryum intermedium TaxID=269621 RepID=A0A238F3R3_9BASI|nr:BQ2448_5266 [Microbotryum intermedium]
MVLRKGLLRPATIVATRPVSTHSLTSEQNLELLNKQRALRPNSPWHIYQPQLTSMSSIANRATGVGLTAVFYAAFLSHLGGLDSATMVQFVADLPEWFKLTTKTALGGAMSYHTINGLRHLSWDSGKLLELKTSYAAGYAVIGASVASTLALLAL